MTKGVETTSKTQLNAVSGGKFTLMILYRE